MNVLSTRCSSAVRILLRCIGSQEHYFLNYCNIFRGRCLNCWSCMNLQVYDDLVVVDTSVADQITAWRRSQHLPDVYSGDHSCSGRTCSYYQIGDVFLCEKTGRAHGMHTLSTPILPRVTQGLKGLNQSIYCCMVHCTTVGCNYLTLDSPLAVCDDTCKETVLDSSNELLVCTVSGRCFDRWLSPAEENGAEFVRTWGTLFSLMYLGSHGRM